MKHRRIDWVVLITTIVFAASCSGGGCGGCASLEPIPGGFPAAKRTANATQLRVTPTAIAKITADPAAVIGPLIGGGANGTIDFNVPGSCGSDPKICCDANNQPLPSCGPVQIDLKAQPGDQPRMVLTPAQGASRLDLTLRARVKTANDLPISYSGIGCGVGLDSTKGSQKDIRIDLQVLFTQDPTLGTTRIMAQNVSVTQIENADVSLSGNIGCQLASGLVGTLVNQFKGQLEDQIAGMINDATCKSCTTVADCGAGASACDSGTCMVGNQCMQELGIDGRARGTALFGGFSPGTTGALDLYEVAGGYATTDNAGIALGMLGGMQPGGTPRDRCGPPGTEPAPASISPSAFFQGNARPDNNAEFDVAIGLHKSQLAQFAWAGYDGGLLCLTIGNSTVSQLTTDTLGLLSRSLGRLVETNAPMAIGLRPQSPPVITLGKNTFTTDGSGTRTLTEPLLDLKFSKLEIDFFVAVDDQYVRSFTVVADVDLPIGLDTAGAGEIVPVFGDTANAFTNVSVKNSDIVTESPADLASLFPTLLNLVLPQLSGGLGGFSLPSLGGLNLAVTDITAVDNDDYLAIFANLVPASQARSVETKVTLAGVEEPDTAIARDPRKWRDGKTPAVTLDFGTDAGLEWSYRIDASAWSPWSTNRHPRLAPQVFWLPGQHRIEVRAREQGKPETIDHTPEVIEVVLGTELGIGIAQNTVNGFHGTPSGEGCACNSTGGAQNAGLFAVVILLLVLPVRRSFARLVRRARRLGSVVWLAAVACLPGCDCGSSPPCGDVECLAGDIPNGGLGRFTSIAADDQRVVVATYDSGLGDLVVGDTRDPSAPTFVVVDGVPDVTPTHEPSSYRGGIEEAGPNVGAWTSIALSGGLARVSYQDREAHALKFAYETKQGVWKSYVVDPGTGEDVGQHTSLVIDGGGRPAIAYVAVGNDDGSGHRVTELRLARPSTADLERASDWGTYVIARANGTCAGLCATGEACVAGANAGDPETCTAVGTGCAACGDGEVCIAGACPAEIAAPTVSTLATGTGLFVSLVSLSDGRLAAAYYDRNRRALVLAVENGSGTNTFTETVLDQTANGDRGWWTSAVVDGNNTVHIAYQDAISDTLMYTTWNGTPGTPEVVDDGQRTGDRTHTVGASASLYFVNGSPAIAYQDGLTSDVYLATKSGTWSTTALAAGPSLDGISIAATSTPSGSAYIAWDKVDAAGNPVNSLVVQTR